MRRLAAVASALLAAFAAGGATLEAESLFFPPSLLPLDDFVPSVAIGDVTGDGRNDVVMGTGFCAPA